MDKVRVGIVGAGIGRLHGQTFRKCTDAEVAAICDVDEARARAAAEELDVPSVFTDYRRMMAEDGINAIAVCTPNAYHAPVAIAALQSGKHVLCEKPLAMNAVEGAKMVRAAKKAGKVLMIGFNNRFRGDTRLLKKYIEDGELGEIYYAKTGWVRRRGTPGVGGWFTTKALSGGGPLIDLGVHVLDLALWLMGNPKPVSVTGSTYSVLAVKRAAEGGGTYDVEDLAAAFVKLENGATVILEASWESHIAREEIYTKLIGTEGGAELDPLRIYKDNHGSPVDITPQFKAIPGHELEIRHFVDCVKGESKCISTGEHGLHVMRILDAIYESAQTGRAVDIRGAELE
jgi:predicted dehydrogenase